MTELLQKANIAYLTRKPSTAIMSSPRTTLVWHVEPNAEAIEARGQVSLRRAIAPPPTRHSDIKHGESAINPGRQTATSRKSRAQIKRRAGLKPSVE